MSKFVHCDHAGIESVRFHSLHVVIVRNQSTAVAFRIKFGIIIIIITVVHIISTKNPQSYTNTATIMKVIIVRLYQHNHT